MKKIGYFLLGAAFFIGLPVFAQVIPRLPMWKEISNYIIPVNTSYGVQVPSLGSTGNPCVTVDSSGHLATTTCGTGGGAGTISTSTDVTANSGLTYWTGVNTVSGTTSPTVGYITATSTTATSTFAGGLQVDNNLFVQRSNGFTTVGAPFGSGSPTPRQFTVNSDSGQAVAASFGNFNGSSLLVDYSASAANSDAGFRLIDTGTNGSDWVIGEDGTHGGLKIGAGGGLIKDAAPSLFIVAGTQNIGVGTDTPQQSLSVNGNVGIGTSGTVPAYGLGVQSNILAGQADVQGSVPSNGVVSVDAGLNFNNVLSPGASTATLINTPGNIDAGQHKYRISYYTADGETSTGAFSNTITTTSSAGQISITLPVSTDPRVIGRKIYRTKATNGYFTYLVATIANNTQTSYTDNTSDASLGSAEGTERENTTADNLYVNGVNALTLGANSLYFGQNAGNANSSGQNTFIGGKAGETNTTGTYSTYIGTSAGKGMTTGGYNTAIGYQSMNVGFSGTGSGANNVALGTRSLRQLTTGGENVAVGSSAMNELVNGQYNVGIGFQSSLNNVAGQRNVSVGSQALFGTLNSSNVNYDVALGTNAGYNVLTGADYNTLVGYKAGFDITTGSNNILLGDYNSTNNSITTGSSNIIIGDNITDASSTASNQLNIGNVLFGTTVAGSGLSSGNFGIGSSTPGSALAIGTGASGININGSATSTFPTGLNITSGCYAVNGTCIAGTGGSGTVTSVGLSAPTGFSVSGSPVTNSGTLGLSYATGYAAVKTASTTNWNTFYNTPSTQITAGTGLTWSGNTLNGNTGTVTSVGVSGSSGITVTGSPITTSGTIALGLSGVPNSALTNSSLTVNGTAISLGGSGTVTAASSTLLADKNTFSGASTLFTGNVGIGASSLYKLNVQGQLALNGVAALDNSANYIRLGDIDGGGTYGIKLYTDLGQEATLLSNGNFGVGTSSPYTKLGIAGSGVFSGNVRASTFTATSTTATSTFTGVSATAFGIGSNLYVNSAGKITAKDTVHSWTGTLSPTHTFNVGLATSTTWIATSTAPYNLNAQMTLPFSGTARQAVCKTNAGTLTVQFTFGSSNIYTAAVGTTNATTTFSGVSFTEGASFALNAGNPASSPKGVNCTVYVTEN